MKNILSFGASPMNSAQENASAIQRAVNEVYANGGGTVYVPAGRFVSGNIELKSNVTLHLDAGAILFGSDDYNDYQLSEYPLPFSQLMGIPATSENGRQLGFIYAVNAENITICGQGTINGNGLNHRFPNPNDPYRRRPMLIYFDFCENVHIQDVNLENPSMFTVWGVRSRRIWIRGVRIQSMEIENGDGLDFNGSSDVTISDCIIEAGDDAISLKTTYPEWANRNYSITNCVFRSVWAGVRIGPESAGDMSEVTISNCVFENCNDALKIQNCGTGVIENIRISNVVMRNVHRPLFMTASPFRLSKALKIRPKIGGLHDIFIDGMTAHMAVAGNEYQRNCFVISGWKEVPIDHFELRNAKVYFRGEAEKEAIGRVDVPEYLDYSFMYADVFSINGNYPASGVFMRHVNGAKFDNCCFIREDEDMRPLLLGYDMKNIIMREVNGRCTGKMFAADDAEVRMIECSANGEPIEEPFPFSAEEKEKYNEFIQITERTNDLFEVISARVDEAQELPCCEIVDDARWIKEEDGQWTDITIQGKKVMLALTSYGDAELYVNGISAAVCRVEKLYRNMIAWAVDVTDMLHPGKNRIEIRWDDMKDRGGCDCILPFGMFNALKVGLITEMRIHYKA